MGLVIQNLMLALLPQGKLPNPLSLAMSHSFRLFHITLHLPSHRLHRHPLLSQSPAPYYGINKVLLVIGQDLHVQPYDD